MVSDTNRTSQLVYALEKARPDFKRHNSNKLARMIIEAPEGAFKATPLEYVLMRKAGETPAENPDTQERASERPLHERLPKIALPPLWTIARSVDEVRQSYREMQLYLGVGIDGDTVSVKLSGTSGLLITGRRDRATSLMPMLIEQLRAAGAMLLLCDTTGTDFTGWSSTTPGITAVERASVPCVGTTLAAQIMNDRLERLYATDDSALAQQLVPVFLIVSDAEVLESRTEDSALCVASIIKKGPAVGVHVILDARYARTSHARSIPSAWGDMPKVGVDDTHSVLYMDRYGTLLRPYLGSVPESKLSRDSRDAQESVRPHLLEFERKVSRAVPRLHPRLWLRIDEFPRKAVTAAQIREGLGPAAVRLSDYTYDEMGNFRRVALDRRDATGELVPDPATAPWDPMSPEYVAGVSRAVELEPLPEDI